MGDFITGTIDLFAWTTGLIVVAAITQPLFKTLEGTMIGFRHKGNGS